MSWTFDLELRVASNIFQDIDEADADWEVYDDLSGDLLYSGSGTYPDDTEEYIDTVSTNNHPRLRVEMEITRVEPEEETARARIWDGDENSLGRVTAREEDTPEAVTGYVDYTPPDNVDAVATDDDNIEISWSHPRSDCRFDVLRSTESQNTDRYPSARSEYNTLETSIDQSPFVDTDVETNETYHYVVTTRFQTQDKHTAGGAINGALSLEASAEVEGLLPPENLTADSITRGEIELSWDEDGDVADEYGVYRATTNGDMLDDYEEIATSEDKNFSDSGLTDGKGYFYRVTSRAGGDETEPSNEADAITGLLAPTLDTVKAGSREVDITWTINDNNDNGDLTIFRNDAGVETVTDLTTDSYTDTGTDLDGKEYSYKLERDTGDAVEESGPGADTTDLPSVEDLNVDAIGGRFATLSWTDPSNNTDFYRLLLREDADGEYSQDGVDIDGVGEGGSVSRETSELLDGQLYEATVETHTEDTSVKEAGD